MIQVDIVIEGYRPWVLTVDASLDTSGCRIPPRMTKDERREFFDGCEIMLLSPITGKRLKKLERKLPDDVFENIREEMRCAI